MIDIDSGVKCGILFTTRFQNTKLKRPLNDEIRDQIKSLKSFGRQYVRRKNPTNVQNSEIKLRKLSEMILKTGRMQLLNSIKQILRKFRKYVNSKTKYIEK